MEAHHHHTSNLTHSTSEQPNDLQPNTATGHDAAEPVNLQADIATRPDENVTGSATKMDETQTRVPFKAKVEGYAKKFAGKTFGKEHEVAAGEARLRGEDKPKHYKQ
ncbi:hypothetical protein PCANC_09699 [Puccinia coronata f. sp. avenae]|uniref:Uncharacterized protein n=1 Tax=Puccinia coronata f. sp. avenae TaxID=200324 RepID=A0A2N5V7F6_9BASI|nr:hypothetical protein PCANC_09699 [Puccinia coronata f. sp. avenae]